MPEKTLLQHVEDESLSHFTLADEQMRSLYHSLPVSLLSSTMIALILSVSHWKVIGQADAVLLAEVYAAGEAPIVAADGRSLARALRVAGKLEPVFVDDIGAMPQSILDNARDGDVVLCMGAGSIGAVAARVVELAQESKQ